MSMDILNEDFEIIKKFLNDWKEPKHGREITKKIDFSQKFIANRLIKLEEEGILTSKKKGNIKQYTLNLKNQETTDVIIIAETIKKNQYLKKHPELREILKDTNQIIGIFGSQEKGTANKESDIDLFIIGKNKENYEEEAKIYDIPLSKKKFTKKEFKKSLQNKNPLIAEIAHHHIIIHGTEEFTKMIARNYYGNN